MVVWHLMLNSDDKSVWPGPASPCCIFTVSQGIATTVTAHQARAMGTESGGERERETWISEAPRPRLLFGLTSYHVVMKCPPLYAGAWLIMSLNCSHACLKEGER